MKRYFSLVILCVLAILASDVSAAPTGANDRRTPTPNPTPACAAKDRSEIIPVVPYEFEPFDEAYKRACEEAQSRLTRVRLKCDPSCVPGNETYTPTISVEPRKRSFWEGIVLFFMNECMVYKRLSCSPPSSGRP
jgi:hypothetical protein